MRSSMRWPRSDLALCSPRAQRTASPTLLFLQPLGPTIAVIPGSTFTTVFSPNDLKPWSAMDSRRMSNLHTQAPGRPRKKYQRWGRRGAGDARYRGGGLPALLQEVALLVLLPGAAVAWIVAPDLLAGGRARRRRRPGSRGRRRSRRRRRPATRARIARERTARLLGVRPRGDRRQLHRRVAHHLHLEEPLDDNGLYALHHVLEEVEGFLLVLGQRVALAVPAQPDAFLEVVDRQQMILPLRVDDDEHLVALQRAHELLAQLALARRVPLLHRFLNQLGEPLPRDDLVVLRGGDLDVELPVERLREAAEVPVLGMRALGGVAVEGADHEVIDPFRDVVGLALAVQDLAAHAVDDLALLVHHVVVFEEMLADLEVVVLDALLGGGDGARHELVLDRLALLHAQALHDPLDALAAEDAQQVVLEREVEVRGAGIALTARAAAQLVVDAAGFVTLRADDVQAAQLHDFLVLGLGDAPRLHERRPPLLGGGGDRIDALLPENFLGQEVGVAAEEDVGAAAGHVGRDGHGALASRLGHDLGLALVVFRVEDLMADAALLEELGHGFGLLDGHGADEHGLALLVALDDVLDDGVELLALGLVDDIRVVDPDQVAVGRHDGDVELVDLGELLGLCLGRARHPRQLVVHPEVVLEGDRGQRLVLALDAHAFLGLHRLMQAVRPAASGHHAAGELVDDDDLAVLDHVVDVAPVERVCAQPLLHVVEDRDVLRVIEVVDVEQPLAGGDSLLGQRHRLGLLVDDVIALALLLDFRQLAFHDRCRALQLRNEPIDLVVELRGFFGRTRDDQRRACLVDEDRVDLVDDRVMQLALHQLLQREAHVVAQVVEAELVVGAVGDVALVRGPAVDGPQRRHADVGRGVRRIVGERRLVLDDPDRQAQRVIERSHPLRVTLGEVVVDGDDVHALGREGVEVRGQRGHQRLALTGGHLGDLAVVQDHTADELYVEVAHAERAARCLAADGERLRKHLFDLGPAGETLAELVGPGTEGGIVESLHGGFEHVDLGHHRHHPLDVALVLGAEDLLEDRVDHRGNIIRPGLGRLRRRGRAAARARAPARPPPRRPRRASVRSRPRAHRRRRRRRWPGSGRRARSWPPARAGGPGRRSAPGA